jgi:hypothetical protein
MATNITASKSPSNTNTNTNTKPVEATKPVELKNDVELPLYDPAKVEPARVDAPVEPTPPPVAKSAETTIVSITVDARLASKARLLARIRGVTISSLFTDAASREIPPALKLALADLRDEDL